MIRHGTKTPARVLVHFEDPAMEGKEEWVPPSRLKVPWDQADAFHAREARWRAVHALGPERDSIEARAASEVFEILVDQAIAEQDWEGEDLIISDPVALADLSGFEDGVFAADPVSFQEDDRLVVSWPTALKTAKALAARHPDRVVARVAKEERQYQREAIHGVRYRGRGEPSAISPEIIRELDEEHYRPARDLLRHWCGAEPVARLEELEALRVEVKRVGDIAEEAIAALAGLGHAARAKDLAAKLGQTLGSLRGVDED